MFAIPGIAALVVLIYARPQEFFEGLRAVPLLYVFLGLALFGGALDFCVGNLRLRSTPQLPWVVLLFFWSAPTVLLRAPGAALTALSGFAISITLYLLIAHGTQSIRALNAISGVVLAMVLVVCGVGIEQGLSPLQCVVLDSSTRGETTQGRPDGRACETPRSCYSGDAEPGADYACERGGLLGTTSVGGGRVRYRGVLQDPNELALAGGIGIPLGIAFGRGRSRKLARRAVTLLTLALVLVCVVLTGSRGGQLVVLSVLGAYFIGRFGPVGTVLATVVTAPVVLLGGRSGTEASSSTFERLDCWAEALSIWRSHPVFGVGLDQFGHYNYMTAHNSYLLALAELGLPGMLLFGVVVHLSVKIPWSVLRDPAFGPDGANRAQASVVRPVAMALLAAFAGLVVGIFFLSFTYHYVLWIYIGLSGALYSAVRAHQPSFRVRVGIPDLALVGALGCSVIVCVHLYTRAVLG